MYLWNSENGYHVWKWKFHSELAAMGFRLSNKNKICNENVNPIPMKKINFRWEANHIYSHSEWYCYSSSFKIFQIVHVFALNDIFRYFTNRVEKWECSDFIMYSIIYLLYAKTYGYSNTCHNYCTKYNWKENPLHVLNNYRSIDYSHTAICLIRVSVVLARSNVLSFPMVVSDWKSDNF